MPELKKPILLFLALCVFGAGCVTGYVNSVDMSLQSTPDVKEQLFEKVDSIASNYGLIKDDSDSVPGKRVGYFGRPYHYYIFEVEELNGQVISARFIHEARLASSLEDYNNPEKDFLEEVQNSLGSSILKIDYVFAEEP